MMAEFEKNVILQRIGDVMLGKRIKKINILEDPWNVLIFTLEDEQNRETNVMLVPGIEGLHVCVMRRELGFLEPTARNCTPEMLIKHLGAIGEFRIHLGHNPPSV